MTKKSHQKIWWVKKECFVKKGQSGKFSERCSEIWGCFIGLGGWTSLCGRMCTMLAHLINKSFIVSHIPNQWKTAIIRSVAKIKHPITPSDYQPIFFLPVEIGR